MGKGAAWRLVENQRLQPRRRQARSETPHPTADDAAVTRQNARGTRREWPYADPGASARAPPRQKRRDHASPAIARVSCLITLWKLRPATTKHAVDVAHEIPFILRQRRRISQHHQQTAVQRDLCAIQRAQQQIDNLHGRGFVSVNAGRKQQRQVIFPRRRQFARPAPAIASGTRGLPPLPAAPVYLRPASAPVKFSISSPPSAGTDKPIPVAGWLIMHPAPRGLRAAAADQPDRPEPDGRDNSGPPSH